MSQIIKNYNNTILLMYLAKYQDFTYVNITRIENMREAMFLVPFFTYFSFFGQPLSNILIIENSLDSYFFYENPLK